MNKTLSTIIWMIGFCLMIVFIPEGENRNQNYLLGFFSGLLWTALIMAMTKKTPKDKDRGITIHKSKNDL